MPTPMVKSPIDALAEERDETLVHASAGVVAALAKSEVEAQLDAAHKYPRSVTKFLREATSLATMSVDVAEACIYKMPRDGKTVDGPSIRLAEICASAYGNMHVGGRVADVEDTNIVAQGVAWDLEKNLRVSVEVRRRITNKNNRRFSEDMVTLTGNAAASIALRNAIFRVIPKAYVNRIYEEARKVAVGDAKTLEVKRSEWFARLLKMGVPQDRVLARLGKTGVQDVGLDDLALLIGIANAVRQGEESIDVAFPAPAPSPAGPAQDGQRMKPAASNGNAQETASAATPLAEPKTETKPADQGAPPPPPERKRMRESGDDL